jgi:glycosyltransferase involved in cell wall biosynthesis
MKSTPELTLEQGLRDSGCRVSTFSHYDAVNWRTFDVIHVHHLSYGALRAAVAPGPTPFVFTSHDGASMSGCKPSFVRRQAMAYVMRCADTVVALSRIEQAFQVSEYGVTSEQHIVIPNGIDDSTFYYRDKERREDATIQLLYVGQLIQLKRVDVLITALSHLPERIVLNLAYHNPALATQLRALASACGVEKRVQFLGSKNPSELADLYWQNDIVVHPSEAEALPSVVTEAMLCGTPVVATRVGGIPQQLGSYGVIISPGDVDSCVRGVARMVNSYASHLARAREMSDYARRFFSKTEMIERHLALYSSLVQNATPARRATWARPLARASGGIVADALCWAKPPLP